MDNNSSDAYAAILWMPFRTAAELTFTMLGATPHTDRQRKAEALRRQFRVIEGGKRA